MFQKAADKTKELAGDAKDKIAVSVNPHQT